MSEQSGTLLRGVYTQPYSQVVRPEQVWKISKYFLRRWTPYLSPSEVWLVIGARQLSYFNEKRSWFRAYDRSLANAAGLHVKVFRRTLKKQIAAGEGLIATFLEKTADPGYRRTDGVTRQTETRYEIRLDDPLTPGDAGALAYWLRRHSPRQVTPETVKALLEEAKALAPGQLRAADPAPVPAEAPGLRAVADVVRHVFPAVAKSQRWREKADSLHTHLVAPELAHFETQYYRRRWLPALGPGPALLLTYLRSLCFLNEESGEIRDRVTLESGDLEGIFQVSARTLRRWFKKVEEATSAESLTGPFLRVVEANKQPDQKVATTYWLNLKTPLLPEDLPRYRELLAQANGAPAAGMGTLPGGDEAVLGEAPAELTTGEQRPGKQAEQPAMPMVTDEKFPTPGAGEGQKVPHTMMGDGQIVPHTTEGKGQKVPHAAGGDGQNDPHTPPGDGQEVVHSAEGKGQKVGGSGTERGPNKYYKTLADALGISVQDLLQKGREQQQDRWQPSPFPPDTEFAVVVAAGSLRRLLTRLEIQEPARSQIVARAPAVREVLAWYLYAAQAEGLARPLSYVIRRLLAGDSPPLPFLQVAALSWAQWRSYAAAWYLHTQGAGTLDAFAPLPLFQEWGELYAHLRPAELPFAVGEGLEMLSATVVTENEIEGGEGAQPDDPAGEAMWQAVLAELALQMTRATFNAWLADTELVGREGATKNLFVVAVRNEAARAWLSQRLYQPVRRTVQAVTEDQEAAVRFVCSDGADEVA